jgi:hypothetical protein
MISVAVETYRALLKHHELLYQMLEQSVQSPELLAAARDDTDTYLEVRVCCLSLPIIKCIVLKFPSSCQLSRPWSTGFFSTSWR